MTQQEEQEFHALAQKLVALSDDSPWQAMRYAAIGDRMTQLAAYVKPELPELIDLDWLKGRIEKLRAECDAKAIAYAKVGFELHSYPYQSFARDLRDLLVNLERRHEASPHDRRVCADGAGGVPSAHHVPTTG